MMMGVSSKEEEEVVVCMNGLCAASSSSPQWKKGWPLRSGAFAILCHNCGTAYDQLAFCDIFHSDHSGWRECNSCGKRLHCGCIASSSLLEILDTSGVICIRCAKSSALHPTSVGSPKRFGIAMENTVGEAHSSFVDNTVNGDNIHNVRLKQLVNCADGNGARYLLPLQNDDTIGSHHQIKPEEVLSHSREMGTTFLSNFNQVSPGLSGDVRLGINTGNMESKDVHGSPVHTNLTISLAAPSGIPNLFPTGVLQEMDSSKATPSFQQRSRSHHILPKPPKPVLSAGLETHVSSIPQIRVARPPVEGRVKNQLLPRYWPRITEQELQQISGDSNSIIVPLFEKVLSASDAGRIGRLVLPKACAEAYFPPISQPEGIPVRIQDVKGKEWVFQFRFWPNNNSRMYVLEGVTPCIQSMQLQAGDTVTFSRMEPEGKLLMGFRKASNGILMQDTNLSAKHNGTFLSGVVEHLPVMGGYSGLLQSMTGNSDPHLKAFSKYSNLSGGDINWHLTDKHGHKGVGGSLPPTMLGQERKRNRNIGPKSKRLLIDNQDDLKLKLTWEEIQEMFRPPTSASPTTITIEDYEFEEYDEPPVFGKRSIFTVRLSGEQEQWVTCDDCSKWRRLPAEFLIPPSWRCQDNVWDRSRCSCSAPEELSPQELESLLKQSNDFKRRRIENQGSTKEQESTIPDTLAGSTIRGDLSDPGATSVAATTKHPRHRPGCSCIVCIQPPSGKGKHKPTCTCNVCMTVKRRFKTLMMRKKKRQSEREAEIAQRNQFIWGSKEELEIDSTSKQVIPQVDLLETEVTLGSELQSLDQNNQSQKVMDTSQEELDLNSRPFPGEDLPTESTRVSMISLLQVANRPLETYLKQNGLTSLTSEQHQASSGSHTLPQATMDSEGQPQEDNPIAPVDEDEERGRDVELYEPVQVGNDPS